MSKNEWRPEWHRIDNAEAHAVTGSTVSAGSVFPYPITALPVQLQKLPGLSAAYITGYATSSISPEGVSVLGELAAVREDQGIGKGYVWVFGTSGSNVYFNGPYKYFDGHYFESVGTVPIDKLFGNVPPFPKK
jgi:hypothetical protein